MLKIKPDLIFLWMKLWFTFVGFTPIYKPKTAMYAARFLAKNTKAILPQKVQREFKVENPKLMVDPDLVKIRVYTTQSTHKTLSSIFVKVL